MERIGSVCKKSGKKKTLACMHIHCWILKLTGTAIKAPSNDKFNVKNQYFCHENRPEHYFQKTK